MFRHQRVQLPVLKSSDFLRVFEINLLAQYPAFVNWYVKKLDMKPDEDKMSYYYFLLEYRKRMILLIGFKFCNNKLGNCVVCFDFLSARVQN